jgi:hypothetical protein
VTERTGDRKIALEIEKHHDEPDRSISGQAFLRRSVCPAKLAVVPFVSVVVNPPCGK